MDVPPCCEAPLDEPKKIAYKGRELQTTPAFWRLLRRQGSVYDAFRRSGYDLNGLAENESEYVADLLVFGVGLSGGNGNAAERDQEYGPVQED